MARRFGLFALAGLVGVFGLGMANMAGFYGLQQSWGPVWAATIVAVADLIIALLIVLLGTSIRPGPEIELAFDVRKMAIEAIQADARDIKDTVDSVGQQIRQTKDVIAGFVHRPLDTAAEPSLFPLFCRSCEVCDRRKRPENTISPLGCKGRSRRIGGESERCKRAN